MDREALRASILGEVRLEFARSGGPGGQNVNKVNSKVIARLRLAELEGLSAAELERALTRLASRITLGGELLVVADEERDQLRNRAIALERLEALIVAAATLPRKRRPTVPGRAARERRLAGKRERGEIKQHRRSPRGEE